ncbi:MAG: acyltransferase [Bellilinea sp.]
MNRQFPALRGIAIFLVVINHSITLGMNAARQAGISIPVWERYLLVTIKEIGIFAVPIFLFLAGSFFVYAAQGKSISIAYRSIVFSNLIHILLPYIIWSSAFYIMEYFLFGKTEDVIGYAKNLLVGYPNNFVPLLIFFTLLSPILIWAVRKSPWVVLVVVFAYQLLLISILRPDFLGVTYPAWVNLFAPPVIRLPLAIWAIFYPMGIVYALFTEPILTTARRWLMPLALVTLLLYSIAVLTQLGIIQVLLAEILVPAFAIPLALLLNRNSIPFVRRFEKLGKRSYGLYLMNLIVINLLIALTGWIFPFLMTVQTINAALMATITLSVPVLLMDWTERKAGRNGYRLLFG